MSEKWDGQSLVQCPTCTKLGNWYNLYARSEALQPQRTPKPSGSPVYASQASDDMPDSCLRCGTWIGSKMGMTFSWGLDGHQKHIEVRVRGSCSRGSLAKLTVPVLKPISSQPRFHNLQDTWIVSRAGHGSPRSSPDQEIGAGRGGQAGSLFKLRSEQTNLRVAGQIHAHDYLPSCRPLSEEVTGDSCHNSQVAIHTGKRLADCSTSTSKASSKPQTEPPS